MRVELVREADVELEDAMAWYIAHGFEHSVEYGLELAQRFADEYDRVSSSIGEHPNLNAEIEPGVRRAFLRGFPYALVYTVESDRVLVLAVMHHRRRPGYWKDRGRPW